MDMFQGDPVVGLHSSVRCQLREREAATRFILIENPPVSLYLVDAIDHSI